MTLAHLSDIHYPLFHDRKWQLRWEALATRVRDHAPSVIVITGDIIDLAWPKALAAPRLSSFMSEVLPSSFPGVPFIHVPGNHDVKRLQGLGQSASKLLAHFAKVSNATLGWQEPIADLLHVYSVDSNASSWFARGKIRAEVLEKAALPPTCADSEHLHVFAMHHHVVPEPTREGESSFTTDERTLGLDDPDRLLWKLSHYGFDVVLHGHRHLSTFHAYADPRAERRTRACWLIGAPSATKANWQGFNILQARRDGGFEVRAVRQSQGSWLEPELVASRDYDESRLRRWKSQVHAEAPSFDVIDVHLSRYQEGSDQAKEEQAVGGDLSVRMILHEPRNVKEPLQLPLVQVVGYEGGVLRDLSARWSDEQGHIHHVTVSKEGLLNIPTTDNLRRLEISAVILNAIPTTPGDWLRMSSSQALPLVDPIHLRLQYPVRRYLRVTTELPHFSYLQPLARQRSSGDALNAENGFVATKHDGMKDCRQELLAFRAVNGIVYAFTSNGSDPVLGPVPDQSSPGAVSRVLRAISRMSENDPSLQQALQRALDRLRDEVVRIAKTVKKGGKVDLSVDLLSIAGEDDRRGIRVVLTDSATDVLAKGHKIISPVGVFFHWGQGIAGRALRLNRWLAWTRREHSKHVSTWPASDWYWEVETGPHADIYCGPITMADGEKRYNVAMLSFASPTENSVLTRILRAVRQPQKYPGAIKAFHEAVAAFTRTLGAELASAGVAFEEDDDDDGGGSDVTTE